MSSSPPTSAMHEFPASSPPKHCAHPGRASALARGLKRDDNQRDVSKPPAFLGGGGRLVSTAADYGRFCQTLLNGGVLSGARLLGGGKASSVEEASLATVS
jgi:CubicO group peptidase (beta-lactamase class C family)